MVEAVIGATRGKSVGAPAGTGGSPMVWSVSPATTVSKFVQSEKGGNTAQTGPAPERSAEGKRVSVYSIPTSGRAGKARGETKKGATEAGRTL